MAIPGIPRHIPRDTRIDDILAKIYSPIPTYKGVASYTGNPVSGVKMTVLSEKTMCIIHRASIKCTWTVQPSPIQLWMTIDGVSQYAFVSNPVSNKQYHLMNNAYYFNSDLVTTVQNIIYPCVKGKLVKLECEITGGTYSELHARCWYSQYELI